MTSPDISPRRKKLKLTRKGRQGDDDDDDDNVGPNKQLKTNSTNAELEARKKNFMKACLKVSFEAFKDLKKRFQLLYLQECVNNVCVHGDKNANITEIPQSVEQNFNIEIKNNTWYEALEICIICITPSQYLTANVLKDIVEIILNAHEDLDSGYTIDYILRKCQHTLLLQFNMHPPCLTKHVRDCYKKFLTSPMDQKINTLSNRTKFLCDEGIVSHCFERLLYEIGSESSDGTLIEKQEVPTKVEGVKRLHWKKENFELFELLERSERIERCMLVLESVIYLVQTDLALWHSRCLGTNSQMRSQRPLLACLLWPHNCLTYGTVTKQCKKIMTLFAHFIHVQFPERHIKTMSLWLNAVVQMFYMYDRHSGVDFPNTSIYCSVFAKELHRIISPLPNTSILRILKKVQPSFMQYLLGINHIESVIHFTTDILHIIIWCVEDMSWDEYPVGNQTPTLSNKPTLKPHKLLNYLAKKCSSFNIPMDLPTNPYPKFGSINKESQIKQDILIDILFTTFVAYLEAYNIKKFQQTLEYYNNNEYGCDPITYASYSVSDCFIKKYRSIIQTFQELLVVLENIKSDEPSKKLSDLIKDYLA